MKKLDINKNCITSPKDFLEKFPLTNNSKEIIKNTRLSINKILSRKDNRLLVIIGPCSIHDIDSAKEYAWKLLKIRNILIDELEIVMRTYFEKPRTSIGWKGFINDPYIDNSFQISIGLRAARKFLIEINNSGLPTASEFLSIIIPQYLSDLISWGSIGARTVESQIHRELVSGLSCPIGFKNSTNGIIKVAIDAINTAKTPHCFLSFNKLGNIDIVRTIGNNNCHIILRGGKNPNYKHKIIQNIKKQLIKSGLLDILMIDCSHSNSKNEFRKQILVAENICKQLENGEIGIIGVMIESYLVEGNQNPRTDCLIYGKSITDSCINWKDTENLLIKLAEANKERRKISKNFSL